MNHDYAHCADYNPDICPATCFRGQLVRDYREQEFGKPVSWMHLKDTDECRAYRRRPTNADLIRGMTDEELAEWLTECLRKLRIYSEPAWADWLAEEVDDEHTD